MGDKTLFILHGEIKTPPMGDAARIETGVLLRQVQKGIKLSLPHSRPMPSIGKRCHELRIPDDNTTWRIVYRVDPAAVLVCDVFAKKTRTTPANVIERCKKRLKVYDEALK